MFALASVLYIYQAVYFRSIGITWGDVVLYYFDALTDAVPVGLAVCLLAATALSVYNLKTLKEIYVSDSGSVNMAGLVTITGFDKTGTLTEENLEFEGAYMTNHARIESTGNQETNLNLTEVSFDTNNNLKHVNEYTPQICIEIMSLCHSLAIVKNSKQIDNILENINDVVGDLLEVY
jgi:P-type E1-E2 ATPase